ncbi:MAG: hypothetical protein IT262_07245 [Saprospiraceae bacterium]|nr:hypothetical protein [Saprospiraceae bacterium]
MRKLCLIALPCLFFSTLSNAQVSVKEILRKAILLVAAIEEQGHQILLVQLDNVKAGGSSSQTYPLSSGSTYMIVAMGDERIKDIDLCVYDAAGVKIKCDADEKNVAIVSLVSSESDRYKFTVKPFAMESVQEGFKDSFKDGFFALIVARMKEK